MSPATQSDQEPIVSYVGFPYKTLALDPNYICRELSGRFTP